MASFKKDSECVAMDESSQMQEDDQEDDVDFDDIDEELQQLEEQEEEQEEEEEEEEEEEQEEEEMSEQQKPKRKPHQEDTKEMADETKSKSKTVQQASSSQHSLALQKKKQQQQPSKQQHQQQSNQSTKQSILTTSMFSENCHPNLLRRPHVPTTHQSNKPHVPATERMCGTPAPSTSASSSSCASSSSALSSSSSSFVTVSSSSLSSSSASSSSSSSSSSTKNTAPSVSAKAIFETDKKVKESLQEWSRVQPMRCKALNEEDRSVFLSTLRENELKRHIYNPNAQYLKYRRVIVDWMSQVGEEYKLTPQTIHMSVNYLDRILSRTPVPKTTLQLLSMCCILVAAKHEELEDKVPTLDDLNECASNAYTTDSIKQMEVQVLSALSWRLSDITIAHFLDFYLHQGIVFTDDLMDGKLVDERAVHYVKKYSDFFSELCLQAHEFTQYLPSILAAAIIASSRRAVHIDPIWTTHLQQLTRYTAHDIFACYKHLYGYYEQNFPCSPPSNKPSPTSVSDQSAFSGSKST
eukprot:TRINITY_DN271_c1_g2_i1.p1 TRINITY_DN271_c1_g2~~TRINITY_DN271_c1_g2_i1.p1  ORF type:complete len:524 (-),score=173.15 TRINITY_DN271_c1_g2_i1:627-2198(-)